MADHFLHCVLRSPRTTEGGQFLMLCFKVQSSTIINVRISKGGPFLMLCFRICYLIICVRITEGGPFFILRFKVRPEILFRTTEGGPFVILCFKVFDCSFIWFSLFSFIFPVSFKKKGSVCSHPHSPHFLTAFLKNDMLYIHAYHTEFF